MPVMPTKRGEGDFHGVLRRRPVAVALTPVHVPTEPVARASPSTTMPPIGAHSPWVMTSASTHSRPVR
jgi:hypothetical protein